MQWHGALCMALLAHRAAVSPILHFCQFYIFRFSVSFLYRGPEDDDNVQTSIGEDYQLDIVVHRFHGNTKLGTAYPMGR